MIKIKKTTKFDKLLLKKILKIDAITYNLSYQGTYESVSDRFEKVPEMFIYGTNEDGKIVSYICFFPINETFVNSMINNDIVVDDNIKSNNMDKYQKNKIHNIFIISIVVLKEYQKRGFAKQLLNEMFEYLKNMQNENYLINNIYATTVTKAGEQLFTSFNFKTIKKYRHGEYLKMLNLNDSLKIK